MRVSVAQDGMKERKTAGSPSEHAPDLPPRALTTTFFGPSRQRRN